MLTIVAVASSLDGFAAVVAAAGVVAKTPPVKNPTRAHHIWETLRAGFAVGPKTNVWPRELKELWKLRSERASGGLLHPKTVFGRPANHPLVPGVPAARALYTLETAEAAVNLMKDIYGTCKSNVRPVETKLQTRMNGLLGQLNQLSNG